PGARGEGAPRGGGRVGGGGRPEGGRGPGGGGAGGGAGGGGGRGGGGRGGGGGHGDSSCPAGGRRWANDLSVRSNTDRGNGRLRHDGHTRRAPGVACPPRRRAAPPLAPRTAAARQLSMAARRAGGWVAIGTKGETDVADASWVTAGQGRGGAGVPDRCRAGLRQPVRRHPGLSGTRPRSAPPAADGPRPRRPAVSCRWSTSARARWAGCTARSGRRWPTTTRSTSCPGSPSRRRCR